MKAALWIAIGFGTLFAINRWVWDIPSLSDMSSPT